MSTFDISKRLGAVPVELEAVLVQFRVAFRQLASVRPGTILRLPSQVGPVSIRVLGIAVGDGEVLEESGGVAVRVQKLRREQDGD
jgi:flagellar motor switch/type III secretory pathway protein FliN